MWIYHSIFCCALSVRFKMNYCRRYQKLSWCVHQIFHIEGQNDVIRTDLRPKKKPQSRTTPGLVYSRANLQLRPVRERMVIGEISWQRCAVLGQDSDYNNEVRGISGRVTSIYSTEGFAAGSWAGMPYDMPSYDGPPYGGPPCDYMEMPQPAHQYRGPGYGPLQGYGGLMSFGPSSGYGCEFQQTGPPHLYNDHS